MCRCSKNRQDCREDPSRSGRGSSGLSILGKALVGRAVLGEAYTRITRARHQEPPRSTGVPVHLTIDHVGAQRAHHPTLRGLSLSHYV